MTATKRLIHSSSDASSCEPRLTLNGSVGSPNSEDNSKARQSEDCSEHGVDRRVGSIFCTENQDELVSETEGVVCESASGMPFVVILEQ